MKQSISALPILAFLFLAVTFIEFLNTSACLDVTLTSREERMALGADIDAELRLRGARLERVATTADNGSFVVIRMDTLLHSIHLSFPPGTGNGYKLTMRELGLDLAPLLRGKASQFLAWKQTSLRPLPVYYITEPTRLQGSSAKILLKKTAR